MKKAWYLGLTEEDVGDRVILVGDPDRVDRIATHLEAPNFHPVSRGLRSVSGGFEGKTFTVSAFGMGSPIATIVLHELADLGVRKFLRIGTAMYFPPALGGDFLVSDMAIPFEGTSPSYLAGGGPFPADPKLVDALAEAARFHGHETRSGCFATYDAFYREMFAIDAGGQERTDENRRMLQERGVIATDMETSALLAAAIALDVACATLCLGTVNAVTQQKLGPSQLVAGEQMLFEIALKAMATLD